MPIKLFGPWNDGYALDQYTVSSEYIGDDSFGRPQFINTYSEVGKLLHSMKYNGHYDTSEEIAEKCKSFLDEWLKDKKIDTFVAVPPTKQRFVQPVFMIGSALRKLTGVPFVQDVLEKTSPTEMKSLSPDERNLTDCIVQLRPAKSECNLLLIDDIVSTGSTAGECVRVLRRDALVRDIYFLAIAKTKNS